MQAGASFGQPVWTVHESPGLIFFEQTLPMQNGDRAVHSDASSQYPPVATDFRTTGAGAGGSVAGLGR